jgi:hypothetical protein
MKFDLRSHFIESHLNFLRLAFPAVAKQAGVLNLCSSRLVDQDEHIT